MISKKDIEQFRNPAEYIQWFEFHLESTRDWTDREALAQRSKHKGIWKVFYEELFPLYSLLKHKKLDWKNSRFCNIVTKTPSHDVVIENNEMAYLEIGTTSFDDGEAFRTDEFLEKRQVSSFAEIIRKRKKPHPPIGIKDTSPSAGVRVQKAVDDISKLIKKKLENDNYVDGTGLVIDYDDSSMPYSEGHYNTIRYAASGFNSQWKDKFKALFLVGTSGSVIEVER